jgi:hypothetical protein
MFTLAQIFTAIWWLYSEINSAKEPSRAPFIAKAPSRAPFIGFNSLNKALTRNALAQIAALDSNTFLVSFHHHLQFSKNEEPVSQNEPSSPSWARPGWS